MLPNMAETCCLALLGNVAECYKPVRIATRSCVEAEAAQSPGGCGIALAWWVRHRSRLVAATSQSSGGCGIAVAWWLWHRSRLATGAQAEP
eukprot:364482-Chlamydomonas_euryale.AAC.3